MAGSEFDISASANEVVALLNANRAADAMRLLEQQRQDQPLVVQESLDRMVSHRGSDAISRLQADVIRSMDPLADPDAALVHESIGRLGNAGGPPRFPDEIETAALTATQRYDVYASVVETRGNDDARDSLAAGERVALGLRQENSTFDSMSADDPGVIATDDPATTAIDESQRGTGVYDDRIVVLGERGNSEDGTESQVWEFHHATTEPTAQYDHHAGAVEGERKFAESTDAERYGDADGYVPPLDASEGYESVNKPRKVNGHDVDGDSELDLGRLAEGTIEMDDATHTRPGTVTKENPSGIQEDAFRASREAVAALPEGVQRDTNADGRFDTADVNGVDNLNATFKIHRGSPNSTDSAGCQTIRYEDYDAFLTAMQGGTDQTKWQYVLTETTETGLARSLLPQPRPEELLPGRLDAPESTITPTVPQGTVTPEALESAVTPSESTSPPPESPRPQPRPEGLVPERADVPLPTAPMTESLRPQPRPERAEELDRTGEVQLPNNPLMQQITRTFDESGAGKGLNTEERNNVLAATYRAFAPGVDQMGVYNGNLVGTRAPHGFGREPMDNVPVNIAQAKEIPAQSSVAAVERAENDRVLAAAYPNVSAGMPGIGARA